MTTPTPRRAGAVLLFAVAVLAMLALFAFGLARLVSIERRAATNYRTHVEARMLAEAGVSRALSAATQSIAERPWSEPGDWWISGATWPAPGQTQALSFHGDGAPRGLYEVRCYDLGSRLSVNARSPGLRAALEAAGLTRQQAIDLESEQEARAGLRTHEELVQILGFEDYQTVREQITTHGWLARVPDYRDLPGRFTDLPWNYEAPARARTLLNLNGASEAVLFAALRGLSGRPLELGGEAPPAEWLTGDLRGQRAAAGAANQVTLPPARARRLAAEIVACRERRTGATGIAYGSPTDAPFGGPFRSWDQFDAFLERQQTSGGLSPLQRGLIMAICGSDPRPMGYNPDATRRRGSPTQLFDRASLDTWTCELSLGPSGVFEVRARGWVLDPDGKIISEHYITRVIRAFTPARFTSQRELEEAWASPDRDTYQSMPEVATRADVPEAVDPLAGHIRLTTEALGEGGAPSLSGAFRAPDPGGAFVFSRGSDPLRRGGVFSPEGVVVWRRGWGRVGAELRSAAAPGPGLAAGGSLEFWVKFANADLGTDEVLVAVNIDDSAAWTPELRQRVEDAITNYDVPDNLGATIKVERFGDRLRATWFYRGTGNGSVSRYVLILSEAQQSVADWQPGEWHHVSVSWTNTLQNWSRVDIGRPLTDTQVDDGIDLVLDGSPTAPLVQLAYPSIQRGGDSFTLNGETKGNVGYFTGRRASIPGAPGVFVGGFTLPPAPGEDVHDTGMLGAQTLWRYPNATVDDVFVYTTPGEAAQLPRDMRYERNAGGSPITLQLPIPNTARYSVGSVNFDLEVPDGCRARVQAGGVAVDAVGSAASLPSSAVRDLVVGGRLPVQVVLQGPGTHSPVLEGVTVYLLHPSEILEEDETAGDEIPPPAPESP